MQYKEVAGGICAPKGFAAAGVHCGIRANHSEKYDLALIKADVRCAAAGVYTTNKVCGAPIKVDRAHLTDGYAQADGHRPLCPGHPCRRRQAGG